MNIIRYFIFNCAYLACLWYGAVEGVQGAYNVALFLSWVLICASAIVLSKDARSKCAEKTLNRMIPQWFDHLLDLTILGFMVWHGWIYTPIGWVFHMMMVALIYERRKELIAEREKEAVPA